MYRAGVYWVDAETPAALVQSVVAALGRTADAFTATGTDATAAVAAGAGAGAGAGTGAGAGAGAGAGTGAHSGVAASGGGASGLLSAWHDTLASEPGFLVVMDNVEDVGMVAPWLPPQDSYGDVVVTTRLSHCVLDWHLAGGCYTCLPVTCLSPDAAAALLLRCASGDRRIALGRWLDDMVGTEPSPGAAVASPAADGIVSARRQEAAALAHLAGAEGLAGLPLALEWVGAYVREHKRTFAEFLEVYRRHHSWALATTDGRDDSGSGAGATASTAAAAAAAAADAAHLAAEREALIGLLTHRRLHR